MSKSRAAYHLAVPPEALRSGLNVVGFRYGATTPLAGQTPEQPRRGAVIADRIYLRPAAAALNVDFGHPDDRSFLLSGFTPDPPWGADRRFVFSEGKRSRLSFPLEPTEGAYELELAAFAFEPLAPIEVEVVVNDGEPVGTVELGKDEKKHRLAIDQGRLVAGTNSIELRYSKTVKPSDIVEGSKDVRELAAGLVSAHIQPAR